jgi:uncharacterized membrane protein
MKIQLRHQLPTLLKIIALLIGIIAQVIIQKNLFIALGLWFVALVTFFFAFRKSSGNAIPNIKTSPIRHEKVSQWGYVFSILAVIFSIVSFFLFSVDLPNIYAWVIHIISILLILIAAIGFTTSRKKRAVKGNTWHWFEIAALISVLLLAIFLRFYKLSQLPYGFWYDEADNGLNALQIFSNSMNIPVFASSTRLPAHLIYLIAFTIKLFGQTIFAVRIVSALFGLATSAAAFLVGRELFGSRKLGILLALLLAVTRWELIWSRIGMHGVTVPFFALLTFGLILRALRLQRFRDYLLSGFSIGLGLCFYVPFRLFPLVMIILLILISITQREYIKKTWRHLLVLIVGVFVISVPISQFAIFHSDEFWGRTEQVSIFSGRTINEGIETAIKTTGEHAAMFTFKGDRNGRHNIPSEPMLDIVTGSLFIFGIALCLFRLKQTVSIVLLCWLMLMLTPGIFSLDFESPQTLRAIGSLPAACLLAILPINALFEDQHHIYKRKTSILIATSLVLIFSSITAINIYNYFVRQANSSTVWLEHSTRDTIIAREMEHYGDKVDYYVSTFYYDTPTIRYLAPSINEYQRIETHETFPFLLDGQRDAIFFLDPDRTPVYEQIKNIYTNASYTEHRTPGGTLALYQIYLTNTDIQSAQGLVVSYFSTPEMEEEPFMSTTVNQLSMNWTMENPGALPFYCDISGVIFAEHFGTYKFSIESPSSVDLYIDGLLAFHSDGGISAGSIELAKGVHSIEIKAAGDFGKFKVNWQPPDGEIGTIPAENLFLPPVTNNGLLASYYPNATWEGVPIIKQVDPFIHFYFHNPPLPRPYTVEWVGNIYISKSATYEFGLESIDGSQIYIDNILIVDNQTPNLYQGKSLDLSEGFHKIEIRYADLTSATHINLYWKPPNADLQNIPTEVLFLP